MLKNYLKIGLKVLLRRKFYTFISLFGIAFTLVVLMVAASLLDHVFGAFPPERKADRMAGLYLIHGRGKESSTGNFPGYLFLDRYVRTLRSPEKVSIHGLPRIVLSFQNGVPIESYLKQTDGKFWEILDFRFLEGGPFTERDEQDGKSVAVINDATRRKCFGNQAAVGKYIEADGQRFRVVGVVENVPYFRLTPFADIWVPISTAKSDEYRKRFFGGFMALVLGRTPGDLPRIQAEFQDTLKRVENPDPRRFDKFVGAFDSLFGLLSRLLFSRGFEERRTERLTAWLLGFAVLFMLLPAINLVNISVSRIIERAPEIGVRKAFGASSRTLVGQFVVENVVLTLIGGVLGWLGSMAVLGLLEVGEFIPYARFHVNYRVLAAGLGMTLFFGLFSGVYPAWKMSRLHPVDALRGGSK
jgi:putative ABC transport system permease protein